uniref:Uncharacterized protein LOC111111919 isoform X1 n=1 Tax=Crassostrea virginica TaxID=6565 RepID=A0A8B8BPM2_CRAVI|nr:uncharacterized protein LOC111111919 isoform X1 [Crassostrea virginica]
MWPMDLLLKKRIYFCNILSLCSRYDVTFGELQERVVSIYTKIIELLGKDGFDKHIKSNGLFIPDVDAFSLASRRDDIKKIDCPIVIAGETSSGKSSVMNFLIGNEDEVLPTNIEASTTKLCRIRNADNLTILTRNSKEEILQTWSFKSIKNMSKKLEVVASSQDSEALFVDIMLPVSIIRGNVIIVDTPGIGDEEQECMAKIMMDYLKNALAVVFVVNVANAGGIQSDRLCQITAHLRNSMNKGMCCFSPEDTIFLLNKWDTIEHDKRKDKFFESTKTKIRNIWKEINERHILKFSAIKGREQEHASQEHTASNSAKAHASRMSQKEDYCAMFDDFEVILKGVIAKNENKRIKSHLKFLKKFILECHKRASTNFDRVQKMHDDIFREIASINKEKKTLETNIQNAPGRIPVLIDDFVELASQRFLKYLHIKDFKKKMFEETADCTRFNVETRLLSCIDTAAIDWEKEHIENIFLETVQKVFGEKCVQACETLDRFKKKIEKLSNDSWLSTIFTFILSSGVIGGLVRGITLNPAIGVAATATTIVGGLVWKGLFTDFTAVREKNFQGQIGGLIKGQN